MTSYIQGDKLFFTCIGEDEPWVYVGNNPAEGHTIKHVESGYEEILSTEELN